MSIYNNGDQNYTITNQNPLTTNHIYLSPASNKLDYESWMKQVGSLLQIRSQFADLKPFLDLVIAIVEPERMFLLSHDAIADYDIKEITEIVLVISRGDKSSYKTLRTISKLACFRNNNVLLSIHTSKKLNDSLTEGHPYYSSQLKEKHLVFSGSSYRLLETPQNVLDMLKKAIIDLFEKGIAKSYATLERAIECEKRNMSNLSALMLHQSVEQLFRTILWAFDHYPFYGSHNVYKLQKYVRIYMPQLFGIIEKSNLKSLNMAYQSQAMDRFDMSEIEDMSILCEKVEMLLNFAKSAFARKLLFFDNGN